MILPTIHLNGTSALSLADQYKDAYGAISKAMDLLSQACPNARDYYPQGDGAFQTAVKEFSVHMDALNAAMQYCENIGVHCIEASYR